MRNSWLVAAVACIAVAGCEKPTACDLSARPMLVVTAVDSLSRALVPNAVIIASGPASVFPDSASIGVNGRAYPVWFGSALGTYVVTVRAAGYQDWTQSEDVTYDAGICHGGLPMVVTAVMQASQ